MKKTITRTVLASFALLLSFAFSSKAQTTYYDVYLCDAGTVRLNPQGLATINVGDKVHWFLGGVLVGTPMEYNGTPSSIEIDVPTNLAVGLHNYTTKIESKDGCLGLESDPFTVYKLPTKQIALSTPTNVSYCGDNSNATTNSSVITATTIPAETLPVGVGYTYTWKATKNGVAVNPVTTIGSSDGSNTDKNLFTVNTTDAGVYEFHASVVYTLLPGNTGTLRPTNGCEVSTTTSQTVTVTPKPGKPKIVLGN